LLGVLVRVGTGTVPTLPALFDFGDEIGDRMMYVYTTVRMSDACTVPVYGVLCVRRVGRTEKLPVQYDVNVHVDDYARLLKKQTPIS